MEVVIDRISKQYRGKYALKDVSCVLNQGVYGLLGANGAGKTTLINIFVGILKGDGGSIRIDGRDVRDMGRDFLSCIGYLPQYPQFYKEFEVLDFLRYMCALKNIPSKAGEKKAVELLDIVNLGDARYRKIGTLSGGMRQRVGIVQAMLGDPKILILDEPTAGLDPQERIRFRNLITKFSENRIVLLATHIVSDVEFIANQVVILRKGELVEQDSPLSLMRKMEGRVWIVEVPAGELYDTYRNYIVSNMYREEGKVMLRMISDVKPCPEAVNCKPNLEDVFLFYFGEGEVC